MKLFIVIVIILVVLWLLILPRRRGAGEDRQRKRAHNSRRVRYSGFETSVDHKGKRKVHLVERNGRLACPSNCKSCRAGADYQQNQLRVFDDRPLRGRRSRRAVLRGDDANNGQEGRT